MTADEFEELSRLNNELLDAQRELYRKNRELENLNSEKNQAIGIVAHDLRNPLGLIQMCSQMLMNDSGELSEDHKELIRMIQDASSFMLRLVNDTLDLSAIESGTLRLNPRPVELIAVVAQNIERNRILARARKVAIEFQPPQSSLPVEVDTAKFDQVLNNLLVNAVSFSPPGGQVEVTAFESSGEAVIAVRDHGPGISSEDVDRLFRPFVRGRQSGRTGLGTGLGLAIVKRIVEGHGGRIHVQSQPGDGAMFSIHLPRAMSV